MDVDAATRVLLVEDDPTLGRSLVRALGARGLELTWVTSGGEATEQLLSSPFDLVLLDIDIPAPNGWEVLRRARRVPQPPAVILVSGNLTVESAARAVREGAVDCVSKGADFEQVLAKVTEALERTPRYSREDDTELVGQSPAMRRVLEMADRVAASPSASALIIGETGAGKEVLARYIHRRSAAREEPYVAVNLAAIPESLVEAELFGHQKGAFTGSERDREGKFRSAGSGTLLLDELCEMRLALQSKLLRVVENGTFFPVGSDVEVGARCRILAATNREPRSAIEEGALRGDLYYRLATAVLRVPPLRERPSDIPRLARRFVEDLARRRGDQPRELTEDSELLLSSRSWPGNVRELRNIIERALLLEDGPALTSTSIQRALQSSRPAPAPVEARGWDLQQVTQDAVAAVEREQIQRAMDLAEGSVSRAAELLGVSRTTLWSRLRKYDLHFEEPDEPGG